MNLIKTKAEVNRYYIQKARSSFKARFELLLYYRVTNSIIGTISPVHLDEFEIDEHQDIFLEYIQLYWQQYDTMNYLIRGKSIEQIYNEITVWKKENEGQIKTLIEHYVNHTFRKVFPREEFDQMINEDKECAYCHLTAGQINKLIESNNLFKKHITRGWTLEIDRKEPNLEYKKDNCVWCCYWCNNAKTDEFSFDEFKTIGRGIENIWNNRLNKINRSTLPDWSKCKGIALVYPYRIQGRDHLRPLYDKLLTYLPEGIDIVLLVKDLNISKGILQKCEKAGIKNKVEFVEDPDIFDIWLRDYAPLTATDMGMIYPVKFKYDPSYIPEKLKASVESDDKAGSLLGKRFINGGEHSLYFKWDMGNLTHNGKGTAIISNRLICDNEAVNLEHELKPMLHVFLGFSTIIFIPVEPGDETGHVDGMVRFVDEKVLVVGEYPRHSENHNFMEILAKNLRTELGDDYTIIRLKNGEPEDFESEGIGSAVGNHVNFLRINDVILFPYYSDKISKEPLMEFKADLEKNNLYISVIPVDIPEINKLARKGGVLNCISWQVFSNEKK